MKRYLKFLFTLIVLLSYFFSCESEDQNIPPMYNPNDTLQGGYEEETIGEINSTPEIVIVYIGSLPSSVALSMPPPKSQGAQGSCSGWAVTYNLMSFLKHEAENTDYYIGGHANNSVLCSPAYTFNQLKVGDGDCSGSSPVGHLLLLKNEGACTLTEMPYQASDCSTQPNASQTLAASNNRISQYFKVSRDNIQLLKILLYLNKPLVVAIQSDAALSNLQSPFIWTPSGSGSGHSVTMSGYNDSYGGFQLTNSWGKNWGDNGKFYMTYSDFQELPNGKFCFTAFWKSNPNLNNLTNGLTSNFELNNDAVDIQGGNGTLVLTTSSTDRDGTPNNALYFNGTNSSVELSEIINTSEFSVTFWMNSSIISPNEKVLFSQKDETTTTNLGMEILINNDTLLLDMPIGTDRVRLSMNTIIQPLQWYHIAITFDSKFVRFYVNGIPVIIGVCTNYFNASTINSTLGCRYKNSFGNKSNFFQGKIDDFRIYNRAINEAEVEELFMN